MAVTLAMIAAQVGVDRSLVSRVLRGDPNARLSQEKRDQILAVAKESGYRPNRVGQSLRTGRTKIIGVLTPDVTNPFHSILFRGVEAYANAAGYDTILCNTDDRGERLREVVSLLSEGHVDGLLVATAQSTDDAIDWLAGTDLPYILVNRRRRNMVDPWIGPDDFQTGWLAATHLLSLGHRRIAMLTESLNLDNVRLRVEGFQAALMKDRQGDVSCSIMQGLVSRADIRDYMSNLLTLSPSLRPTAVFTPQTRPGEGAASAIYRSGLQIPKDISIIGYTAHEDPDMTSIHAPVTEIGRLAAERLIQHLNEGDGASLAGLNITLPVTIIDRGTTAEPPSATARELDHSRPGHTEPDRR